MFGSVVVRLRRRWVQMWVCVLWGVFRWTTECFSEWRSGNSVCHDEGACEWVQVFKSGRTSVVYEDRTGGSKFWSMIRQVGSISCVHLFIRVSQLNDDILISTIVRHRYPPTGAYLRLRFLYLLSFVFNRISSLGSRPILKTVPLFRANPWSWNNTVCVTRSIYLFWKIRWIKYTQPRLFVM